jgi:polysaccharide export outer membrane protein
MRLIAFLTIFATTLSLAQAPLAPAQKATPQTEAKAAFGDAEYRLGPEDVIHVFVYKEAELSTEVVVRPDGKVSLPLIGEVTASGKTSLQLQGELKQNLTQYVSDPIVNVIVKEVNSAKVSVLGEVKNPGMYKILNKATILDAIALAGGFTEYAKRDKVTLIRNSPTGESQRYNLNIDELIKKSRSDLFYVFPHDKIYVQ